MHDLDFETYVEAYTLLANVSYKDTVMLFELMGVNEGLYDHLFSSTYQLPAAALVQIGILEKVDPAIHLLRWLVEESDFEDHIRANYKNGVRSSFLMFALNHRSVFNEVVKFLISVDYYLPVEGEPSLCALKEKYGDEYLSAKGKAISRFYVNFGWRDFPESLPL